VVSPEGLQQKVDYFYCEECKMHVPCIRVQPGVWEVQCSRCVGECMVCVCHLADFCFGQGKTPVRIHMSVVKGAGKP
jgi:hypothetical protein